MNEPPIITLHSVKYSNPKILHDGCAIPVNGANLLLLPNCKNLIQVKILNKEITLVEGKPYNYIPSLDQIQRREICVQLKDQGIVIYKISNGGVFQVISHQDRKAETC